MAYIIDDSMKTVQYHDDNGNTNELIQCTVMVSSSAALNDIPDTVAIGSFAYTAGAKQMWQKDFDGSWVSISSD